MKTNEMFESLDQNELNLISGGLRDAAGDAAYAIGRSYVWVTAHIFTFGLSSVYLVIH